MSKVHTVGGKRLGWLALTEDERADERIYSFVAVGEHVVVSDTGMVEGDGDRVCSSKRWYRQKGERKGFNSRPHVCSLSKHLERRVA